jgi:hypothetical protein
MVWDYDVIFYNGVVPKEGLMHAIYFISEKKTHDHMLLSLFTYKGTTI